METNLKKIRNANQKNQENVAQLLNVNRSSYAIWEDGIEAIPIKRLISFCEIFNISLDYILCLTNKPQNITTNFNLETFKTRFKEFRKTNNLTQENVAKLLNTNKSVICNYEKGRNLIPTIFLTTICQKYHLSADYLFGRTDNKEL